MDLIGCSYEKKPPRYGTANLVLKLARMILMMNMFLGMNASWSCFDLVQFHFSYSSAIITLNSAFILRLSGSRSNPIKATKL